MEDIIEDVVEEETVIETPEEIATPVVDEATPVKTRGAISFTFTCSKCGKTVCINSDMYTTAEQKKSQHNCSSSNLPKNKLKEN